MKQWKYLFPAKILERGREYCRYGAVEDVHRTEEGFEATVSGTDVYEVSIVMKDNQVTDMECTCPHAEEGNHCKHMAAVLYAIENGDAGMDPAASAEKLMQLIRTLDTNQLQRELLKVLVDEPDQLRRFESRYRLTPPGAAEIRRMEDDLEGLASEYGDYYGTVYWNRASDYTEAFVRYLYDNIQPLIDRGYYRPAFDAVMIAFRVICEADLDCSEDVYDEIGNVIQEMWETCIANAGEEDRQYMSDEFDNLYENREDCYLEELIESVYFHVFDHRDILLDQLNEVRSELTRTEHIRSLLYRYKDLMKQLELPMEEYEQFLLEHRTNHDARDLLLDEAEKKNDVKTQIELLEEIVKEDTDNYGRYRSQRKLIGLYRKNSDTEKEKNCLKDLVLRDKYADLDEIFRLKSLCTDTEWSILRKVIIAVHPKKEMDICLYEKNYDRVMELLPKESIKTADQLYPDLKDQYPEEYVSIYYNYLDRLTQRHPSNSLYDEIRKYLMKLAGVPGGKTAAASLISIWKEIYPTRRAMQTMLNEAVRSLA